MKIKQLIDIFIIILIVLFLCLIIYQLYLATKRNINSDNYSKSSIIEGFTMGKITPQQNISGDNNDFTSNLCNTLIVDISNIQILDNNIINIGNNVNGLITQYNNSNPNNTPINNITLNTITTPATISCSSADNTTTTYCSIINQNVTNINTINDNVQTTISIINQLPNGPSYINNAIFQTLTTNNTVSPCAPISAISLSTVRETENNNINNINILSANISSLNSVVTNIQNDQSNQINNANDVGTSLSNKVGITTN
jgi:hypothetical protein